MAIHCWEIGDGTSDIRAVMLVLVLVMVLVLVLVQLTDASALRLATRSDPPRRGEAQRPDAFPDRDVCYVR